MTESVVAAVCDRGLRPSGEFSHIGNPYCYSLHSYDDWMAYERVQRNVGACVSGRERDVGWERGHCLTDLCCATDATVLPPAPGRQKEREA